MSAIAQSRVYRDDQTNTSVIMKTKIAENYLAAFMQIINYLQECQKTIQIAVANNVRSYVKAYRQSPSSRGLHSIAKSESKLEWMYGECFIRVISVNWIKSTIVGIAKTTRIMSYQKSAQPSSRSKFVGEQTLISSTIKTIMIGSSLKSVSSMSQGESTRIDWDKTIIVDISVDGAEPSRSAMLRSNPSDQLGIEYKNKIRVGIGIQEKACNKTTAFLLDWSKPTVRRRSKCDRAGAEKPTIVKVNNDVDLGANPDFYINILNEIGSSPRSIN